MEVSTVDYRLRIKNLQDDLLWQRIDSKDFPKKIEILKRWALDVTKIGGDFSEFDAIINLIQNFSSKVAIDQSGVTSKLAKNVIEYIKKQKDQLSLDNVSILLNRLTKIGFNAKNHFLEKDAAEIINIVLSKIEQRGNFYGKAIIPVISSLIQLKNLNLFDCQNPNFDKNKDRLNKIFAKIAKWSSGYNLNALQDLPKYLLALPHMISYYKSVVGVVVDQQLQEFIYQIPIIHNPTISGAQKHFFEYLKNYFRKIDAQDWSVAINKKGNKILGCNFCLEGSIDGETHSDIVVYDQNDKVILVVEIDGPSHQFCCDGVVCETGKTVVRDLYLRALRVSLHKINLREFSKKNPDQIASFFEENFKEYKQQILQQFLDNASFDAAVGVADKSTQVSAQDLPVATDPVTQVSAQDLPVATDPVTQVSAQDLPVATDADLLSAQGAEKVKKRRKRKKSESAAASASNSDDAMVVADEDVSKFNSELRSIIDNYLKNFRDNPFSQEEGLQNIDSFLKAKTSKEEKTSKIDNQILQDLIAPKDQSKPNYPLLLLLSKYNVDKKFIADQEWRNKNLILIIFDIDSGDLGRSQTQNLAGANFIQSSSTNFFEVFFNKMVVQQKPKNLKKHKESQSGKASDPIFDGIIDQMQQGNSSNLQFILLFCDQINFSDDGFVKFTQLIPKIQSDHKIIEILLHKIKGKRKVQLLDQVFLSSILNSDIELARFLLERYPQMAKKPFCQNMRVSAGGNTIIFSRLGDYLSMACRVCDNNFEMIKLLVENGASPLGFGSIEASPIESAAKFNNFANVDFLLTNYPDINIDQKLLSPCDKYSDHAIEAIKSFDKAFAEYFSDDDFTPQKEQAFNNYCADLLDEIESLKASRFLVNGLLTQSISAKNPEGVKFFLAKGADPSQFDTYRHQINGFFEEIKIDALALALQKSNAEAFELLINHPKVDIANLFKIEEGNTVSQFVFVCKTMEEIDSDQFIIILDMINNKDPRFLFQKDSECDIKFIILEVADKINHDEAASNIKKFMVDKGREFEAAFCNAEEALEANKAHEAPKATVKNKVPFIQKLNALKYGGSRNEEL